jgi:glycosyltransferase involved in cell wall biosynthesis
MPLVSVCIPVYNCEAYLGKAMESVLAQTYQDFELAVLDDCSSDRSLQIARQYADPRIRVAPSEKNLGAERNWNRCLEEARGEWVKVLCHDDYLHPTCLQKQVEALTAHPNAALTCCARDIVDNNNKCIMTRRFPGHAGVHAGFPLIARSIRWGTNLIGEPSAVLFRREAAQKAGYFNGAQGYMIDLDYWARLLLQGDIVVEREALCTFRVATGSWSVEIGRRQAQQFSDFAQRLRAEGRFGISAWDCWLGSQLAKAYGVLRRRVYKKVAARQMQRKPTGS